jgi:dihydrofolate reductase
MSVISLVLAMADNGVIGSNGRIPWRVPDDMRRFKALTMGRPVIMGRKTWDSLPRKPLTGRTNIVISGNPDFHPEGAVVTRSLGEALSKADGGESDEIMIIGGAEIYRAALSFAHRVHLTEVHDAFDGDARMAKFDPAQWVESAREDHVAKDGLRFSYVTLDRR